MWRQLVLLGSRVTFITCSDFISILQDKRFPLGAPATVPAAPRVVVQMLLYSVIVLSPLYLMCVAKKRTTNFIIITPHAQP